MYEEIERRANLERYRTPARPLGQGDSKIRHPGLRHGPPAYPGTPLGVRNTSVRNSRPPHLRSLRIRPGQSPEDALRVTGSLEPSVTLEAAGAIRAFPHPVLLAWGDRDELFPLPHAERLLKDFPDARLEVIEGSSTFVMVDQPGPLATSIAAFVAQTPTRESRLKTQEGDEGSVGGCV